MRPRVRIYRVEPGRWRAERPRFGFAPEPAVEAFEAPTRARVCAALVAAVPPRRASGSGEMARNVADGLATIPRWDPAPWRYRPKPW